VTRLVRGLQRDDRVERAEVARPVRLAKVPRHEGHPTRELAEMLGGDRVHGGREVERDIGVHVAVGEDLAGELAWARAELEDAELRARGQRGAERGEEVRPIRTPDARIFDPGASGRGVAKVDPDRHVVVVACHLTRRAPGGFQLPSRIDGALSVGQYIRMVMLKLPLAGAGSQLASRSFPGESRWI